MKMVIVIIDYYHHLHHDYFHSLAPEAPSARVVVVSSTAHLGANKELMEGGARASAMWVKRCQEVFCFSCNVVLLYLKKITRERERKSAWFCQKKNLPAGNSHN